MKNYQLLAIILLSIFIGVSATWVVMGDQADAAYERGKQTASTEMVRTALKCSRTGNIYPIPYSDYIVEAKATPKGLKIINMETAAERKKRVNR